MIIFQDFPEIFIKTSFFQVFSGLENPTLNSAFSRKSRMNRNPVFLNWWLSRFYDGAHIKDDDCRSGSLPEVLPGMTSLKDGDLQHSSALAQYAKRDIGPNHPSEINPNSDSRSRNDSRSRRYCNTGQTSLEDRDHNHFSITISRLFLN